MKKFNGFNGRTVLYTEIVDDAEIHIYFTDGSKVIITACCCCEKNLDGYCEKHHSYYC